MAAQVSSLLALSFKLSTSGLVYATKGATTGVATLATGVWMRHYLANSASAGTAQTSCKEAGALLQAALNAVSGMSAWSVRFRSDARWEVCNTASSWSLVWDTTSGSNYVARNVFGYSGNISGSAGVYVAADWQPYLTIAAIGRSDAAGWVPGAPLAAGAILEDGTSYGFTSPVLPMSRTFDLLHHPYSMTERAAFGDPHTPVFGDPTYWQVTAGQALTANRTHPCGILETLMQSNGREWGLALAPLGFDQHVASATTTYERASLDFTAIKPALLTLAAANWSARRHVRGLRFARIAPATRS